MGSFCVSVCLLTLATLANGLASSSPLIQVPTRPVLNATATSPTSPTSLELSFSDGNLEERPHEQLNSHEALAESLITRYLRSRASRLTSKPNRKNRRSLHNRKNLEDLPFSTKRFHKMLGKAILKIITGELSEADMRLLRSLNYSLEEVLAIRERELGKVSLESEVPEVLREVHRLRAEKMARESKLGLEIPSELASETLRSTSPPVDASQNNRRGFDFGDYNSWDPEALRLTSTPQPSTSTSSSRSKKSRRKTKKDLDLEEFNRQAVYDYENAANRMYEGGELEPSNSGADYRDEGPQEDEDKNVRENGDDAYANFDRAMASHIVFKVRYDDSEFDSSSDEGSKRSARERERQEVNRKKTEDKKNAGEEKGRRIEVSEDSSGRRRGHKKEANAARGQKTEMRKSDDLEERQKRLKISSTRRGGSGEARREESHEVKGAADLAAAKKHSEFFSRVSKIENTKAEPSEDPESRKKHGKHFSKDRESILRLSKMKDTSEDAPEDLEVRERHSKKFPKDSEDIKSQPKPTKPDNRKSDLSEDSEGRLKHHKNNFKVTEATPGLLDDSDTKDEALHASESSSWPSLSSQGPATSSTPRHHQEKPFPASPSRDLDPQLPLVYRLGNLATSHRNSNQESTEDQRLLVPAALESKMMTSEASPKDSDKVEVDLLVKNDSNNDNKRSGVFEGLEWVEGDVYRVLPEDLDTLNYDTSANYLESESITNKTQNFDDGSTTNGRNDSFFTSPSPQDDWKAQTVTRRSSTRMTRENSNASLSSYQQLALAHRKDQSQKAIEDIKLKVLAMTGRFNLSSSSNQVQRERLAMFSPTCQIPRNTDLETWSDPFSMNMYFQPNLTSGDHVVAAKMRIYKLPQTNVVAPSSSGVVEDEDDEEKKIRISVYFYTKSLKKHRSKKRLMDSVVTTLTSQGSHLALDVRQALRFWRQHLRTSSHSSSNSNNNHGMVIQVEDQDGRPLKPMQYIQQGSCHTGEQNEDEKAYQRVPALFVQACSRYVRVVNGEAVTYVNCSRSSRH